MYRDTDGSIRVIEPALTMERLIKGASDKIRQAGRGMPAVLIRQLENLRKLAAILSNEEHCEVVRHQAAMIMKAAEESIPEPSDVDDVRAAYSVLLGAFQSPTAAAGRARLKVRARHG
jgi:uncharacterized membrane protein